VVRLPPAEPALLACVISEAVACGVRLTQQELVRPPSSDREQ
jgi:hypothetical protein